MKSFLCHLKLYIHLSLKYDWVKLKSCSNDLVIVCISWLFWQKYLVLLESLTAALDHPGKRIACNSFYCVTRKIFLLVHCHFRTCANLLHKLNAVQLSVLHWGYHWGCRAFFLLPWMLNRTKGIQHDSLIPGSVCSAGGCEEIHK